MVGKSITTSDGPTSYNQASSEMLEVAQAAQRARDQVADVLMKVKSEYPEWVLPLELDESRLV